jgi:hypothetical protein
MKAVIANWITALRSGKYEKGDTQLYDRATNCYCALGVLGKVMGYTFSDSGRDLVDSFGRDVGYDPFGNVIVQDLEVIWGKNDRGWSFNDIADWLEQGGLD